MTEQAPPDDTMDGGLRAAFGAPSEATPLRASVLHVLRQKTGGRLDLHLHANDESSGIPVRVDEASRAMRDPNGRYQVLGEIGRGGVGVVFKGRDQDLGRDVAMKVLRAEYADKPEIIERFVEEAQIGGQLQHPGIVPVYEIGLQPGDRPYFAMKLVKGETLQALLSRREQVQGDRRRFLAIFEQICQTIAYAHARRVVHRDLKPANVMVGAFGEVQVVDWGFAKVLAHGSGAAAQRRTSLDSTFIATVRSTPGTGWTSELGSTMGTPAYMPPEQARGRVDEVDERSDVFGLGAILCEILTGAPPYLERDGDVLQQAARGDLRAVNARLESCGADPALIALCRDCLAAERHLRPASGREVAAAIAAHSSSVEERAQGALIRAAEARVRARATVWLAAAAVALVTLGGGFLFLRERDQQARRDADSARVASATAEAEQLFGDARSGDGRDTAQWTRALDAATRAATTAAEAEIAEAQRQRVTELLAKVQERQSAALRAAARAAKDREMLQRLLETRVELDQFAIAEMEKRRSPALKEVIAKRFEQDYGRVFSWYLEGMELGTLANDAAIAALSGPIAVELAVALDDWRTWPLRLAGARDVRDAWSDRLLAISMALDPDPWRNRLRTLLTMSSVDGNDLASLRAQADFQTLPPVSLTMLAHAFDLMGASDIAVQVLHSAYELHPTDFGITFDLGQLWYAKGDMLRALSYYHAARALRPQAAIVHHNLGALRRRLGDLEGALASHRQAIALDPESAVAHDSLGLVLVDLGQLEEARTCYERAIALSPSYARAYNDLGFCLDLMGRHLDAIETYRQALDLDERNPDTWRNLGDAQQALGQLEDAVSSLRRSLELASNDPVTMNSLGLTLRRLRRHEESEQVLRAAIVADPGFGPGYFNLGVGLQERGQLDEALTLLRRAEEIWSKAADPFGREWYPKVKQRIAALEAELGKDR
ncbi:MAG: tetratricopeptide repeat protein [Planctomycetes bacterium]|nr:tetratricopeptide repeat protein [Planctomycetota bacterium]